MTARKPDRWRIFKCQCAPECRTWWVGVPGHMAINDFPTGADAIAAFARGYR
jgi:hypothetical protein